MLPSASQLQNGVAPLGAVSHRFIIYISRDLIIYRCVHIVLINIILLRDFIQRNHSHEQIHFVLLLLVFSFYFFPGGLETSGTVYNCFLVSETELL